MKQLIAAIIFVACAVALAGCGTMKGFGQDMQGSGQSIQKAASR